MPVSTHPLSIVVSIPHQTLTLKGQNRVLKKYSVSTAKNGAGEKMHSEQTPRGQHIIRAKIGTDRPLGAVFVGRRFTGEVYSDELAEKHPDRDWILTRILWLSGIEPGFNRLGDCDSMRRYIYIHGTPDAEPMGVPLSHGCVRMRNNDVRDLFDRIATGCPVLIED